MRIARALQAPPFPRPCIAEMGGKNACIVSTAADLERAATGIVRSAFGMGGQKCSALSRLYVHEQVADALLAKLLQQIESIGIGDPARREHWLGPVTTQSAYDNYGRYAALLRGGGARLVTGGERLREGALGRGWCVRPTIAEAPPEPALWSEEMSLPILMSHRVAATEAAIPLANTPPP